MRGLRVGIFGCDSKIEAAWTVWHKGKNEKLVSEIEFWGTQLDQYSSWTIPGMFPDASRADIATHVLDISGSLNATNLKAQVMMARTDSSMATAVEGFVQPESFRVDIQRITLLGEGYISPRSDITVHDIAAERTEPSGLGGIGRRQWANFSNADGLSSTIIEFKSRTGLKDAQFPIEIEFVTKAMDKLVGALRIAAQKKETFHVMHCEGWYEAFDHFGLIYQPPFMQKQSQCESLGNILLKQEYRELLLRDLENRVKLAKALAWSLCELHSVDWVHKSFHPDNILLFGEEISPGVVQFDWSCPYVVGFDSSRSNTGISEKQNSRGHWMTRLYIHPDRQLQEYKRYKKTYDIYSLGVVLLEIGRLRSFLEGRVSEEMKQMTPHKLKETFIRKAKGLQMILGRAYREVVLACLTGEFDEDDEYQLLMQFRCGVCEKLDQIKIS